LIVFTALAERMLSFVAIARRLRPSKQPSGKPGFQQTPENGRG